MLTGIELYGGTTMLTIAKVDATRELRRLLTACYGDIARVTHLEDEDRLAKLAMIDELVAEAVNAYHEIHRDYHDIRHPVSMFHFKRLISESLPEIDDKLDPVVLILLIALHDVVVKLGRDTGWNEGESAKLAERHLTLLGAEPDLIGVVTLGILSSIHHRLDPGLDKYSDKLRFTVMFFLDLDLFGLGQGQKSFDLNTERIWHEWCAVCTRAEFDKGRSDWAASYAVRDKIYHTATFVHLNEPAKKNLSALALAAA